MWSLYDGCWFFFIYAFLGWCCEVVYAAAQHGVFVNRGFLNGPVCPIYGFGLCLVTAVLYPVRGNLALLFLGSVLLASALELAAGFLMEKLFHHRWWDDSNRPLNIGGYVCLLFSLLWGLACVLVVDVVHPIIARFVAAVPRSPGVVLLCVFGVTLLLDLAITVMNVRKLNRRLCALDEAAERMRGLSDGIGSGLAGRNHRREEAGGGHPRRAAAAGTRGGRRGAPVAARFPEFAFPAARRGAGGAQTPPA